MEREYLRDRTLEDHRPARRRGKKHRRRGGDGDGDGDGGDGGDGDGDDGDDGDGDDGDGDDGDDGDGDDGDDGDGMLLMTLRPRSQGTGLRGTAERLVITTGTQKGRHPSPAAIMRILREHDEQMATAVST